jgi:hypothetical protein
VTTLNSTVTSDNYAEVLRLAQSALAEAQARHDQLEPKAERAAAPISDDPAIASGIRRRSTARQVRRDDAKTDRDLQVYQEFLAAKRDLGWKQKRVERLLAGAPVPYTEEELASVAAVRTEVGWYAVVKVNRTTVSVEAGFPWPHKIPRASILEVRAAPSPEPGGQP